MRRTRISAGNWRASHPQWSQGNHLARFQIPFRNQRVDLKVSDLVTRPDEPHEVSYRRLVNRRKTVSQLNRVALSICTCHLTFRASKTRSCSLAIPVGHPIVSHRRILSTRLHCTCVAMKSKHWLYIHYFLPQWLERGPRPSQP
jgi:hypothetical protein